MWARAVWAALLLCGIVTEPVDAGIVRYEDKAPNALAIFFSQVDRIVSMAEQRSSTLAEPILIPDHSPNVEIQPSLAFQVPNVIPDIDNGAALPHGRTGSQRYFSFKLVNVQLERLEPIIEARTPFHEPRHILGREVAGVSDYDVGVTFGGIIRRSDPGRCYADIGALKNFSVPDLSLSRFLCRPPQCNGGNRQPGGEESQPKREESGRVLRSPLPEGFGRLVLLFFLGGACLATFVVMNGRR